jgi:signal transduction histidine kinase/CheY-like chemotaxis protein
LDAGFGARDLPVKNANFGGLPMKHLKSLQAKFIVGILPIVVSVAVLFSAIFAVQNYRFMREALTTKQRVLPEVYSVALAALSRDFAQPAIKRVIGSLALDPDVARATVVDDEETVLAQIIVVRLADTEKHALVEHMIIDDTRAGRLNIKGKIKVVFHERTLRKSIIAGIWRDASLIMLLVAAIVLAALLANKIIIGRPLQKFVHAIRRADEEHVREPVAWSSRDEIGQVIVAYNNMVEKLGRDEAALKRRTDELTRSVAELRALGDVAQAINSTLELDQVLSAIVTHAVKISGADAGTIYEYNAKAGVFEPRTNFGLSADMVDALRDSRIRLGDTLIGKSALQRVPLQIADVTNEPDVRLSELLLSAGIHAILAVPLVREDRVIGALSIRRRNAGEFPASVIELLQTFASQSVLAIENARLFKQIQEKSAELEAASEHKSQFLANMSHELRTPMNAIIGVSEMLLEDARDLNRDGEVEPLERILKAAQHLLALINDILDLSKIEAGKMQLNNERFAVEPLIQEVASTIAPIARKNGNTIEVSCESELGMLVADPMRVRQALLNLASNAAKFTEQGTITMAARRRQGVGPDWLELQVSDTGIGMTAEQISRLFQEFVQADASTTRKYGGTGLGLAISQRFCRMMGGDIVVESTLGRGSTFTIRLPAAGVETMGEIALTVVPETAARTPADSCNATVLVIDDDLTVRQLMERHLMRDGFDVVTAENGVQGLARARVMHPCAITLDVMMPDIDGWAVLAALKGDPALADIPVVLVSIVDDRQRGYTLGAAEYMVKPIDRERLSSTLRSLCGRTTGHLLLVEDDDTARAIVRQGLERDGWRVTEAANGRVALECLRSTRRHAIVLDLMMPEIDGFEFIAELRGQQDWRKIPVIVVTALDLSEEERRQLNGDVERVIQKNGLGREQLLHEVSVALAELMRRDESQHREHAAP